MNKPIDMDEVKVAQRFACDVDAGRAISRVHYAYGLSFDEADLIFERYLAQEKYYEALSAAYHLGVCRGQRYERNTARKVEKKNKKGD